jgi:DNA repair exonuclease SbcCD ATPase subunit
MDINFKVSDNQKHDFLFRSLNPNFNEEGGWVVDCGIVEVYDEYAIVVNYEDGSLERVFYTKDNEADTMEITGKERCFIVDVNEEEKAALDSLKTSYEAAVATLEENTNTINTLTEENNNYSIKVGELETNISTLTIEKADAETRFAALESELNTAKASIDERIEEYANLENAKAELDNTISELNATLSTITAERDELAAFKKNVVDTNKLQVIESYAETLDADVIKTYTDNMDNYTAEELDMHLTYECKKVNPTIFSKNPVEPQPAYVPKQEPTGRGINDILAKYEKK